MRNAITVITLLMLTFSAEASVVEAADVRGTISLPGAGRKAPSRYVVRGQNRSVTGTTETGMVAIALEPLGESGRPKAPDTPYVMAQENTAFNPNLLVVPVGSKVTFPNRDAFFHNVFSYSPPRSFDLGRYPKGETRTVKFEESGVVRIFCEIHASMYATILVAPSEHFQLINSQDGFSFPGLPAGRYRVVAVDAAGRRAKAEITVTPEQTGNLSLVLE